MKDTRSIMGMPVTVHVADPSATEGTLAEIFAYFIYIDGKFSTYKTDSEISRINRGEITAEAYSPDMHTVLRLSEETKQATDGYFDIRTPQGLLDPSGLVKGWAIHNAAEILVTHAFKDFFIEAGGDIEARGLNEDKKPWTVGIRNPFSPDTIVKALRLSGKGIATSGTYVRGEHVYDPHTHVEPVRDILSLSVIGPDVYEADRFATAAFAMGRRGIHFIEQLPGFDAYAIDTRSEATMTSGFERYTV